MTGRQGDKETYFVLHREARRTRNTQKGKETRRQGDRADKIPRCKIHASLADGALL